jgi:hypothetical protein
MTPFPEDEEITRPDHITIQQWRRLISAFDSVPREKRDVFLSRVAMIASNMKDTK